MKWQRVPRQSFYFPSSGYLEGIKNNRLNDSRFISKCDYKIDCYSQLNVVYDDLFDRRGINRKVNRKANKQRIVVDRYRGTVNNG